MGWDSVVGIESRYGLSGFETRCVRDSPHSPRSSRRKGTGFLSQS